MTPKRAILAVGAFVMLSSQIVLADYYETADHDHHGGGRPPVGRPNPPRYEEPGHGRPHPGPGPVRPRPGYPPGPVYPGPVRPGPVYPGPIYRPLPPPVYPYPPSYPDPYVDRVVYVNRYVNYETLQLFYLSDLDEYYRGYNIASVDVNTSGGTYATQVDLLINGGLVDSQSSYGYAHLTTRYRSQIGYDVYSLDVRVNGQVYVGSITVHLSRY